MKAIFLFVWLLIGTNILKSQPQEQKQKSLITDEEVERRYEAEHRQRNEAESLFNYYAEEAATAQELLNEVEFVRNVFLLRLRDAVEFEKKKDLSFKSGAEKAGVDRNTARRAVEQLEEDFVNGRIDIRARFENVKKVLEEFRESLERNESDLIDYLSKFDDEHYVEKRQSSLELVNKKKRLQAKKLAKSKIKKKLEKENEENDLKEKIAEQDKLVKDLREVQEELREARLRRAGNNEMNNLEMEADNVMARLEGNQAELMLYFGEIGITATRGLFTFVFFCNLQKVQVCFWFAN